MKHKIFALILALTVVAWTQEATTTAPAAPQQSTEKAKCACCDKMASADAKGMQCCARKAGDSAEAKDVASCCNRKDGKSCCGGKEAKACMRADKGADSCCKDSKNDKTASACCGGKCEKDCCKKMDKNVSNCCHHQKNA